MVVDGSQFSQIRGSAMRTDNPGMTSDGRSEPSIAESRSSWPAVLTIVAVVLFAIMLTALLVPKYAHSGHEHTESAFSRPESPSRETESVQPSSPPSADVIFSTAAPSVVQVLIQDSQGRPVGLGSGFVVGTKGLVATNFHVVEDAHRADVVFADKSKLAVTGVTALDQTADIAILKVAGRVSAGPLELATLGLPRVGEKVYAIGNPRGYINSLSDGLVSGLRDSKGRTKIQITAPISPGSSGGPVLNADGKVVGMARSGFTLGAQNLNFAVPAADVEKLVKASERDGPVKPLPVVARTDLPQQWFSADTLAEANRIADEIRQQFGKELAIESFETVPADRILELSTLGTEGRNRFFHEWALSRAKAKGQLNIYILICKRQRHLHVLVGDRTLQRDFTIANRDSLIDLMASQFSLGRYDQGLIAAADYVRSALRDNGAAIRVPRRDTIGRKRL
jgi:S1-C subfamily serine protease